MATVTWPDKLPISSQTIEPIDLFGDRFSNNAVLGEQDDQLLNLQQPRSYPSWNVSISIGAVEDGSEEERILLAWLCRICEAGIKIRIPIFEPQSYGFVISGSIGGDGTGQALGVANIERDLKPGSFVRGPQLNISPLATSTRIYNIVSFTEPNRVKLFPKTVEGSYHRATHITCMLVPATENKLISAIPKSARSRAILPITLNFIEVVGK